MKIGMIFPGQGSQSLGMGKDLYDRERIVQEYFEEASSCLDQNFVRLCFASSDRELRETINAQTSIFLLSASLVTLLAEKYGITPNVVAGHSSGEYAALFAAGGMSLPDALYLLKKRATFMDEATKKYPGGMVAVLGMSYDQLFEICNKYNDPSNLTKVVEIVNYNAPQQLVISGSLPELDKVIHDVRAAGCKVIPLNVAGAFHSRLITEAATLFSSYMVKVDFKELVMPLINNCDAQLLVNSEDVKASLVKQLSSPVQWWQSMQHLQDCDVIIEVGPGNKLAKMLKREWPTKNILSLNSVTDLRTIVELFGKKFDEQYDLDALPEIPVNTIDN